jgi:hypothetical protein
LSIFTKTQRSLPCSQDPTICPNPNQLNPVHAIPYLVSILISSSPICLGRFLSNYFGMYLSISFAHAPQSFIHSSITDSTYIIWQCRKKTETTLQRQCLTTRGAQIFQKPTSHSNSRYTRNSNSRYTSHSNSRYTLFDKNQTAWNFVRPAQAATWRTVAFIIRVVLVSPYLCIRGVSLSSIHYNQSRRVYINQRHQYIRLISS